MGVYIVAKVNEDPAKVCISLPQTVNNKQIDNLLDEKINTGIWTEQDIELDNY